MPEPKCRFCSKHVPDRFADWEICRDCNEKLRKDGASGHLHRPYAFVKVMAVGLYVPDIPSKGTMGAIIGDMKHGQDRSEEIVHAMMSIIGKEAKDIQFDTLIPIPASDNSSGPGWNICQRLSALIGIPVLEAIGFDRTLMSSKDLIGEEKFQNVFGKVRIKEGTELSGKRILLVDDIITTCGTAHWCSLELMKAKAYSVHIISACRTVWKTLLDFVGYEGRY